MTDQIDSQEPQEDEGDFGLPARLFDEVLDAVEAGDAARLDAIFEPLHPADIADLLEQIDARDRRALLALWKGGMDGEILSELDDNLREEIIQSRIRHFAYPTCLHQGAAIAHTTKDWLPTRKPLDQ